MYLDNTSRQDQNIALSMETPNAKIRSAMEEWNHKSLFSGSVPALILVACALFSSLALGQNIISDPTTSQTIVQPSGTEFGVNRFEKVVFADQFGGDIQAAVNAVSPSGGAVYISPGTYEGPTTIPSGTCIIGTSNVAPPQIWSKFEGGGFNSFSAGPGSENLVKLTYANGLTISALSQICIVNIVLDMGAGPGLVMTGVSHSEFAIAVVNVISTSPAVTIDGSSSYNTLGNRFQWLITEGGNEGVRIGNPHFGSSSYHTVTENVFDWLLVLADTQPTAAFTALDFVGNCDSNVFSKVELWFSAAITNYNGIIFNSASTAVDKDADAIRIDWYDETGLSGTSGTSITINPSFNNSIRTGVLLGGSAKIAISSWSQDSTFTWDQTANPNGDLNALGNFFWAGALVANAGTPSLFLDENGVTKWQIYSGSYDELEFNNGAANVLTLLKNGTLSVTGNLSVGGTKNFKIDHPLDPANKYLYHTSVESPDMMNIYSGEALLDEKGEAEVQLPEWFEALNKDYRYQLTCIGYFAPVYVAEEVNNHRFRIAGGRRGLRVSWQVTGVRHDPYADAHRSPIEVEKPPNERGHYLHPELYGSTER